ncbi:MAG: DNA-deoxyinosine glycosylase [Burkholderiaceae bacterium]|nr:DNA-deoxyinosine glycosylase [Burkholderiaceae bacterium]
MHTAPARLTGLAPVIDCSTHTLILGSFPGVASLEAQQYYGFKHNQFWRLLSAILQCDLVSLNYQARLACLLGHGIGIWDTYCSCYREGSLDTAIRQGDLNDFADLHQRYPALKKIRFNGKAAAKILVQMQALGYQTTVLPSSSPAHASLGFEEKLRLWQQAFM